MAKITYFQATYYDGGQHMQARFTGYEDAVYFCAWKAARFGVELFQTRGRGRGIIGQWHNGKVTLEFQGRNLPDAVTP